RKLMKTRSRTGALPNGAQAVRYAMLAPASRRVPPKWTQVLAPSPVSKRTWEKRKNERKGAYSRETNVFEPIPPSADSPSCQRSAKLLMTTKVGFHEKSKLAARPPALCVMYPPPSWKL